MSNSRQRILGDAAGFCRVAGVERRRKSKIYVSFKAWLSGRSQAFWQVHLWLYFAGLSTVLISSNETEPSVLASSRLKAAGWPVTMCG